MNSGMIASLRVVLDTNILVSALIYNGKPGQLLELALDKQITIFTSKVLVSELQETLAKKFDFSEEKIKQIDQKLNKSFIVVYPKKSTNVLRDDDDNRVLEAAVEGKCDYIVTGDKELLDLGSFKGIKIVAADKFLYIFKKNLK